MKKKECPSCAMKIESSLSICSICGYEFPKRAPWITGMAIFLLLILLLSYFL